MLGQHGAQRASLPPRLARAIVGASLAALIATPAALAATPTTAAVPAAARTVAAAAASVSAPWLAEEAFYLRLVNCTRTGGWVLPSGACSGYGTGRYSRYVKPLIRSPGISDAVTRPYARLEAIRGLCSHFLDHDPGYRLRRAGFRPSLWAENIGCSNGSTSVHAAVLAAHLFFQREKATNGGHWRAIKNPGLHYIGIGVWKSGSHIRLVTDFFTP